MMQVMTRNGWMLLCGWLCPLAETMFASMAPVADPTAT
jgi:hypothetical protein